jgi:hypothetical protein
MPRLDLRDLDRRLVPAAAVGLRRLLDGAAQGRARLVADVRRAVASASAAARRLDDRALDNGLATGPLVILRDVPQLALLAVAAVFLAGAGAAVLLGEPEPSPSAAPSTSEAFGSIRRLGVPPGGDVELYLEQTRVVLDDVAARLPAEQLFAVVHFSRYVPAAQVPELLEGAQLQRVYLRASGAGPDAEIIALPVESQTGATVLQALCAATSARKADDAQNFSTLADSIEPTTPEEQASKADFEAESVRAAAESQAYAGECVTAFAAVVQAPAEVLKQLVGRDGVRGVEPAPIGVALADLDVQPLLPEATGVVPSGRER